MDLKTMSKTVEKFALSESISLDDLHGLMVQSGAFPGNFKLKKAYLAKQLFLMCT